MDELERRIEMLESKVATLRAQVDGLIEVAHVAQTGGSQSDGEGYYPGGQ